MARAITASNWVSVSPGLLKRAFAGRADRHSAIGVRHNMQRIGEQLRRVGRGIPQQRRLSFDAIAHGLLEPFAQVAQTLPACGMHDDAMFGPGGLNAAAPCAQGCRQCQTSVAGVNARAQRVMDQPASRALRRPVGLRVRAA